MYLYVCILYYYSSTTIEKQSASLLLNSVNVDRLEQTLKDTYYKDCNIIQDNLSSVRPKQIRFWLSAEFRPLLPKFGFAETANPLSVSVSDSAETEIISVSAKVARFS